MGDCQDGDLRVDFDRMLKLTFLGSKVTTDAGLLAYRELDEALGLTEMGEQAVADSRLGQNKQHAWPTSYGGWRSPRAFGSGR